MAVTNGEFNTQAKMDDLAALANSKLLPLVNAAIAAGLWPPKTSTARNIYDHFTGNNPTNPQPDYLFDPAVKNWMSELNRIRGDFQILLFDRANGVSINAPIDAALFFNPAAILSGKWVVGINDTSTFLTGTPSLQGTLPAILRRYAGDEICPFKNVEFYYAQSDAPVGFGVSKEYDIGTQRGNAVSGAFWTADIASNGKSFTANIAADFAGAATVNCAFLFNGTATAGAFTITTTADSFTAGIVPVGGGRFELWIGMVKSASAGSSSFDFSITPPATATWFDDAHTNAFWANLISVKITASQDAQAIIYSSSALKIQPANYGVNAFMVQAVNPTNSQWVISDRSVKGVWVANTFPPPANNVFIDQDIPPFVGLVVQNNVSRNIAIANNGGFSADPSKKQPYASTMRQTAPVIDFGISSSPDDSIAPVHYGETTRPAKWLVRRNTDFVPFDLGFGQGAFGIFSGQVVTSNGGINYYSVFCPPNMTYFKLRLVKNGTGLKGWKNGVLQYGDALPLGLSIYASVTDFPDPNDPSTYDFVKTDNEINVPNDGGGAFFTAVLGAGFNYAIVNNTASDILFDAVEEEIFSQDTNPPTRNYFPPSGTGECFSYCLDGSVPYDGLVHYGRNEKPIPQNGYCIFKVMATRSVQDNGSGQDTTPMTGAEIIVTLGQNKLQTDGSLLFVPLKQDDNVMDFTVTILATERDSGDVPVFWPVISGNELVWKCDSSVSVEAWANWQPCFFNLYFANGFNDPIDYNAMNFRYSMAFRNFFSIPLSAYQPTPSTFTTTVQFPMFKELYNDLENCLNLIA